MDGENDQDETSTTGCPPPLSDKCEEEGDNGDRGGQYTYRDYSHVTKDGDPGLVADNPSPSPSSRTSQESSIRVQKLPVKLYVILAQKEFHDIISWLPHGRSWKILQPALFESMVMPLFFEYSNYHSFNRLVNAWSFRRIGSGPDNGSYYHELFLRGMPHLQKYMRRLPKMQKKLPMSKKNEPDFYSMNKTKPLPSLEDAPIPIVNTNTGGIMGGSGQYRDSNSAQCSNQQQRINTSTVRSPADLQTSAVSTGSQMVQRYAEDLYSPSQIHGAVHLETEQLHMQPMMVPAAPGVISTPVVQGSSVLYGNPYLRALTLHCQQNQFPVAPALMHNYQGVDSGFVGGVFESSLMGGSQTGNLYQAEGAFATCPMTMQQYMPEYIMMCNHLQQQKAYIGIE